MGSQLFGGRYCELLQTHQDHILMQPDERAALLNAVGEAVKAAGGIELQLSHTSVWRALRDC